MGRETPAAHLVQPVGAGVVGGTTHSSYQFSDANLCNQLSCSSIFLERVEHGEKIVITRRGVPVAMLTQPPQKTMGDVRQVVKEMLAYRDRQKRTIGELTIREMIDEGRRY